MSTPPRAPRRTRSDGQRSRERILVAAAHLATVEGIDGLSIGRLAEHIGMSKSGLFAHFGSKEELQLAAIATAERIYTEEVLEPAMGAEPGIARLEALSDRFLDHVLRRVFPGGCFFASVAAEVDTRPGPVRDRVVEVAGDWLRLIEAEVANAQERGEIDPGLDPAQLAFEIDAMLALGNSLFVMAGETALDRARRGVADRLAAVRVKPRRRAARAKA